MMEMPCFLSPAAGKDKRAGGEKKGRREVRTREQERGGERGKRRGGDEGTLGASGVVSYAFSCIAQTIIAIMFHIAIT